jgi:hypothetical protein
MRSKRVLLVMVAVFVVTSVSLFTIPGRKFKVGMTSDEVQAIVGLSYPLQRYDLAFLPGEPTPEQMEKDGLYVIRTPTVSLVFNHHKRLIRIRKWWQRN